MSTVRCQKSDFVSALGNICNCCTVLGKSLIVVPPVTLIKERPTPGSQTFNVFVFPDVYEKRKYGRETMGLLDVGHKYS